MHDSTGRHHSDPVAARSEPRQKASPRSRRHSLEPGFLALVAPEGGLPFAVSPRDLSRTGIGFYTAASLDVGAACAVTLRALDGALVTVPGRVARRRAVRGRIHEVGVRLDPPIDPARFLESEQSPATPVIPFGAAPTPPTSAAGEPPPAGPPDQAGVSPYDRVADLADSMRQVAEEQGPIDDLHAMVQELVRLCESARPSGNQERSDRGR
jgi:hypothetical protein